MHYLKEKTEGRKCSKKKIVLISDLGCAVNPDKIDVIIKNLKSEDIEFSFL